MTSNCSKRKSSARPGRRMVVKTGAFKKESSADEVSLSVRSINRIYETQPVRSSKKLMVRSKTGVCMMRNKQKLVNDDLIEIIDHKFSPPINYHQRKTTGALSQDNDLNGS